MKSKNRLAVGRNRRWGDAGIRIGTPPRRPKRYNLPQESNDSSVIRALRQYLVMHSSKGRIHTLRHYFAVSRILAIQSEISRGGHANISFLLSSFRLRPPRRQ